MKNKTFTERLKEKMEDAGVNETYLSKETGINKQTLSSYIKGERFPSTDSVELIASALNVSPAYLLGWETKEQKDTLEVSIPIIVAAVITLIWIALFGFSLSNPESALIMMAIPVTLFIFFGVLFLYSFYSKYLKAKFHLWMKQFKKKEEVR